MEAVQNVNRLHGVYPPPCRISAIQYRTTFEGDMMRKPSKPSSAIEAAMKFLKDEIGDAELIQTTIIFAKADKAGTDSALTNAKRRLGIVTHREGYGPGETFYYSVLRSR
jgi:hypothetical protein